MVYPTQQGLPLVKLAVQTACRATIILEDVFLISATPHMATTP